MKDLKEFDISFIGLKEGLHQFEYSINNSFFDFFKYDEFSNSNVKVTVDFLKKSTLFELEFAFSGWVEVPCDLTNELYQQSVNGNLDLVVKFGEEFNDENEELLILPHSEYKVNIAQYIYEAIILAVPLKRIHPGIEDGTLQSDILEKLNEYNLNNENESGLDEQEIDPIWNKLKSISNRKK